MLQSPVCYISNPPNHPQRIILSGTPKEIGHKHGILLSPQIRSQITIYSAMFKQTSSLTWSSVLTIASSYSKTIQKLAPTIYSEMEGIASGAGVDILDIVALNCRSEIALGLFSDGCTALGWKVPQERENGGEVILAQNWDWTSAVGENCVLMSIEQTGKPNIWMVTEAGIVGKIGFNSCSVGTNLNAIRAKPTDSTKVPIHIALRICLESPSAASAIKSLESLGGVASSCHILIADPSGPIGLELSPLGNRYLSPNARGIVYHTNHFIENRYVDEPPWLSGSSVRLARIQELTRKLDETGKPITAKVLREKIFSDGFNAPQAICCEEDPERPVETRSTTLFNIAMKFCEDREPSAEVVWGKPGRDGEWEVLMMPW